MSKFNPDDYKDFVEKEVTEMMGSGRLPPSSADNYLEVLNNELAAIDSRWQKEKDK